MDFFIITGAGILDVSFAEGKPIACHPGIIPTNRGLDSFKWAILNESSSLPSWLRGFDSLHPLHIIRSVAQLVEHRSPKPGAVGSSPSTPAISYIINFLLIN